MPWFPNPREVSFSTCGKYIIAVTGSPHPTVLPLPPWAFPLKATSTAIPQDWREHRQQGEASEVIAPVAGLPGSTVWNPAPRKSLSCQQGNLITQHNAFDPCGRISGLQISNSDNAIRLHRDQARKDGKDLESLLLTRLPNWGEVNIDVSIKRPSNSENHIQIILNKAAKPWNELVEAAAQNLPAIVKRDKQSILEENIASGHLHAQGNMLEGGSAAGSQYQLA